MEESRYERTQSSYSWSSETKDYFKMVVKEPPPCFDTYYYNAVLALVFLESLEALNWLTSNRDIMVPVYASPYRWSS